jgi:hypothetical protein
MPGFGLGRAGCRRGNQRDDGEDTDNGSSAKDGHENPLRDHE